MTEGQGGPQDTDLKRKLADRLLLWADLFKMNLYSAGMEGLLPSAERPYHDLLLTHALELRVSPTDPATNLWEVKDARLNPLPAVKIMTEEMNPGDFDWRRKVTLATPLLKGQPPGEEEIVAGVMWIVLTYHKLGMICAYPMRVIQTDVYEKRRKASNARWLDDLKAASLLPRTELEEPAKPDEAGDGGSEAPTKKRRTRRPKAKAPPKTDDGQESVTSATSSVSSPLPPPTTLSLNWADLVEDDDGELPDLSDW